MAAKKVSNNPHEPVSNVSSAPRTKGGGRQSEPPSAAPKSAKAPMKDGHEAVENYKLLQPERLVKLEDMTGLKDIGVASFGEPPPRPKTVHGTDDRVQITDTHLYPWCANASLLITAPSGTVYIGTGWFIGPHTLATAGHCVYIFDDDDPTQNGWARSIQVIPGRNGTNAPFGVVNAATWHTVNGWVRDRDEEYDYGAIKLSTELGNQTGWYGFGNYDDADLTSAVANIAGYPGDKPDGTQWYAARRIANVSARKVHYDIDTYGGQSGAAVWREVNGARYGVAVHAYGGGTTNSGTRINSEVFDMLKRWKA